MQEFLLSASEPIASNGFWIVALTAISREAGFLHFRIYDFAARLHNPLDHTVVVSIHQQLGLLYEQFGTRFGKGVGWNVRIATS